MSLLRRLVWRTDTERLNPLIYPFFLTTLAYGVGFLLFGWWSGVGASSLFQTMLSIHSWMPEIWGGLATLVSAGNVWMMIQRKYRWLGEAVSYGAVLLWLFACVCFAMNGVWLVILTVGVPNLWFWLWYYGRVKRYTAEVSAGLVELPSVDKPA
jgi:hypothetical protein